jgi:hypothetical protein
MRLGREHGAQPASPDDSATRTTASEKGRPKVNPESWIWIPCPRVFPDGYDAESWSRLAATVWWEHSRLPHKDYAVDQLAAVFRGMRETGYASIRSTQFWLYLRDPAAQPLSVYVCAFKEQGDLDQRLRVLTGADDPESVRKPQVARVSTERLGTGLRAARYRAQDDQGTLLCLLSYAFRVAEYETDLQVFTGSTDLRALTAAGDDLERFVQSISVQAKTREGR